MALVVLVALALLHWRFIGAPLELHWRLLGFVGYVGAGMGG